MWGVGGEGEKKIERGQRGARGEKQKQVIVFDYNGPIDGPGYLNGYRFKNWWNSFTGSSNISDCMFTPSLCIPCFY